MRPGLAVLAVAYAQLAASSVVAWEPVAGTRELGPRWSGPMIYRVNEQGSDDLSREVLLAEIHKGMLSWTRPDCTSARARYDGLTDELPSSADVPGADNVIAWRETEWSYGPEAVAVTAPSFISSGSGKPPQIVAATMWLNGKHWTWVTAASRERQINAYSVFLHEAGHYWGLGHTPVAMSVMNDRYTEDLSGLAPDDVDGICSLYPRGKVSDCSAQLASSVPPPRFHTVKYAGVLAPASAWRTRIRPQPEPIAQLPEPTDTQTPSHSHSAYRGWAELLKRTFDQDVLQCPSCGGRMKRIALVTEAKSIVRYLTKLGEPADVPSRSAGRGPPYWKSTILRRKAWA